MAIAHDIDDWSSMAENLVYVNVGVVVEDRELNAESIERVGIFGFIETNTRRPKNQGDQKR